MTLARVSVTEIPFLFFSLDTSLNIENKILKSWLQSQSQDLIFEGLDSSLDIKTPVFKSFDSSLDFKTLVLNYSTEESEEDSDT